MSDHATVVAFKTLSGDTMHRVDIFGAVAQRLADVFLPPDGTRVSVEDLQAAVERLVDAANAVERLEAES